MVFMAFTLSMMSICGAGGGHEVRYNVYLPTHACATPPLCIQPPPHLPAGRPVAVGGVGGHHPEGGPESGAGGGQLQPRLHVHCGEGGTVFQRAAGVEGGVGLAVDTPAGVAAVAILGAHSVGRGWARRGRHEGQAWQSKGSAAKAGCKLQESTSAIVAVRTCSAEMVSMPSPTRTLSVLSV
jgi:hypothetical protein